MELLVVDMEEVFFWYYTGFRSEIVVKKAHYL